MSPHSAASRSGRLEVSQVTLQSQRELKTSGNWRRWVTVESRAKYLTSLTLSVTDYHWESSCQPFPQRLHGLNPVSPGSGASQIARKRGEGFAVRNHGDRDRLLP